MNHSARLGIIDLGTNSLRFDVHLVDKQGVTHLLHREKLMVRLGENLFIAGKLDARAVKRTLQAFASFKKTADDLEVTSIVAFGTSALREATDGNELLKAIKQTTGIDLRVISGAEEARLIAAGILSHRSSARGCFALVDIGGGSTEISVCRDGKIVRSESFPLGVARLQQIFLKKSPPDRDSVTKLRKHVRKMLRTEFKKNDWPRVDYVIGSSGTIRVLFQIVKKRGESKLTPETLFKTTKQMGKLTIDQLTKLPGMEPRRVDMILAGALLLEECLKALKAEKVSITRYSLRDGILQEQAALFRENFLTAPQKAISTLFDRASRFGIEKTHAQRLVLTAEKLFERLRPLHRLDQRWRTYLSMAVLMRDTGRLISPVDHEQHSYYIVKHSDLPLEEPWEIEFVAQLCLHHEGGKLDLEKLPFDGEKAAQRKKAFQKLLALLRIVDALDPAYQKRMSKKKIRINPEKVFLRLSKGSWLELAVLRLQQRKGLFEQVFSRLLSAEAT